MSGSKVADDFLKAMSTIWRSAKQIMINVTSDL